LSLPGHKRFHRYKESFSASQLNQNIAFNATRHNPRTATAVLNTSPRISDAKDFVFRFLLHNNTFFLLLHNMHWSVDQTPFPSPFDSPVDAVLELRRTLSVIHLMLAILRIDPRLDHLVNELPRLATINRRYVHQPQFVIGVLCEPRSALKRALPRQELADIDCLLLRGFLRAIPRGMGQQ